MKGENEMTIMELIQTLSTFGVKYGNIEVKYFDVSAYDYDDVDDMNKISELHYDEKTNTVNIY